MFYSNTMKRLIFIGIVASVFALSSCSEEMVGPSIDGIEVDTFAVNTNNDVLSVDFSKGETVPFTGSWEIETKWIITIKGHQSGATKTLTGKSKELTNVLWDGTADDIFFKNGETCDAILSFESYDNIDTAKALIQIAGTFDYVSQYNGTILSDYETIGGTGWGVDNPITEDGVDVPQSQLMTAENDTILVPEGNTYLQMSGKETGGKYYLAGNSLVISDTLRVTDATKTYINFFVYGYPEYYQYSTIFIFFRDKNGVEAGFQDRVALSKIGWNEISIALSKFKATSNETGAPFDYEHITEAGYSLFSVDGTACSAKAAFDYFIVTEKPLFSLYN